MGNIFEKENSCDGLVVENIDKLVRGKSYDAYLVKRDKKSKLLQLKKRYSNLEYIDLNRDRALFYKQPIRSGNTVDLDLNQHVFFKSS